MVRERDSFFSVLMRKEELEWPERPGVWIKAE